MGVPIQIKMISERTNNKGKRIINNINAKNLILKICFFVFKDKQSIITLMFFYYICINIFTLCKPMKKSFLIFFFFFHFILLGNTQTLPNNRLVDWSLAGLQDTTTNNFIVIDMQNYGVIGDSITSNDSILSSVLTSYLDSNIILIFPSGIFLFNNTIDLPSNTIIKGQGPYSTVFKFDLGGNGNSIDIQGSSISTDTTSFTQSATKDSSSFIVLNALLFSNGDWIRIIQVDSNLVTSSWARNTVGQIVQIKQIINHVIFIFIKPLIVG